MESGIEMTDASFTLNRTTARAKHLFSEDGDELENTKDK